MFTALLRSNRSYWIAAYVFITLRICLRSRCLAANVYFDFTIPAIVRHVTKVMLINVTEQKNISYILT
jgi:hypothetical protein